MHGLDVLLQVGVLCLGLLQDGDLGIGVFPEGEEIFVGGSRADAGGIAIRIGPRIFGRSCLADWRESSFAKRASQ